VHHGRPSDGGVSVHFPFSILSFDLQVLLLLGFQFRLDVCNNLLFHVFVWGVNFGFGLLGDFTVLLNVKNWFVRVRFFQSVDYGVLVLRSQIQLLPAGGPLGDRLARQTESLGSGQLHVFCLLLTSS